MADTHLTVINAALSRIAGGEIMAPDEDTELAGQIVPIYYTRLNTALGLHDWSFNGKTYALDAIPQTAANDYDGSILKFTNGWRFAFALPGNRIGDPRKVLRDPRNHRDPLRDFLIESGWIYADCTALWAVVGVMVDPPLWHPGFRHAMEILSAADFCVPVTHDGTLAEALRAQGEGEKQENGRGGLIGRAMVNDAVKARTATAQWRDPLSDARLR